MKQCKDFGAHFLCFAKITVIIFTLMIHLTCAGQGGKYELSKPLSIKQRGWNKVLCMKNGNTFLFHFGVATNLTVKIFDSTRKEIGGTNENYRVLDNFIYEQPEVIGLYDIKGEAVLFIDQEKMTKHRLVRLRYNGTTGKLVQETLLAESESANRRIHYSLIKNKDEDNYAVYFFTDVRHPVKYNSMYLVYFNKKHEWLLINNKA